MSFPTLNIGDLIAKTPIVQGGMGPPLFPLLLWL